MSLRSIEEPPLALDVGSGDGRALSGFIVGPTRERVSAGLSSSTLGLAALGSSESIPFDLPALLVGAGPMRTPSKVLFNRDVSVILFDGLTDLPKERKAELWWQEDDYTAFLQLCLELVTAYRFAAKELGVPILEVSGEGTHGPAGYRAMVQAHPELENESRQGLALGRRRQRAKDRAVYIVAVLQEQRRQRELFEARLSQTLHGASTGVASVVFGLDVKMLARVAQQASENTRRCAHLWAQALYERNNSGPCLWPRGPRVIELLQCKPAANIISSMTRGATNEFEATDEVVSVCVDRLHDDEANSQVIIPIAESDDDDRHVAEDTYLACRPNLSA